MDCKCGTSYFGNRILKHVTQDLKDMKKHNCDIVIHTFSENDMQYYKDTMKDIVAESHNQGLEVWVSPWKVCGIFGGEAYSALTLHNYKFRQISNRDKNVPAMCPNKKATKRLLKDWVDAAVYIGVDNIMWDEPHFYGNPKKMWQKWCCRCKTCRKKYKEMYDKEMPRVFTENVKKFREVSVYKFIKEMSAYTKKKGVQVSTVLTIWDIDNTERITKIKDIDIVTFDPYWGLKGTECDNDLDVAQFVRQYAEAVVPIAKKHKKQTLGWIQGFKIKKGTEEDVRTAVRTFKECGVDHVAIWGYNGCGHMSYLKSEDPEKVWKTIGEAFEEFKN